MYYTSEIKYPAQSSFSNLDKRTIDANSKLAVITIKKKNAIGLGLLLFSSPSREKPNISS